MSMTAIVSEDAARRTDAGTASSCVARACHSQTARGVIDASVSAGSPTEVRGGRALHEADARAHDASASTTRCGVVVLTSATWSDASRRTTTALVARSAAASALPLS